MFHSFYGYEHQLVRFLKTSKLKLDSIVSNKEQRVRKVAEILCKTPPTHKAFIASFRLLWQSRIPIMKLKLIWLFISSLTVLVIVTTANGDETSMDTRDGEDLMLQCRFSPDYSNRGFIYYWTRISGPKFDNVAVDEKSLSSTYKWVTMQITERYEMEKITQQCQLRQ